MREFVLGTIFTDTKFLISFGQDGIVLAALWKGRKGL